MVANIRLGSSPDGALYYNKEKADKDEAEILYWQIVFKHTDIDREHSHIVSLH